MENEVKKTQEQVKEQRVETLKPWQFQPGKSGNPGGRKKGSKSLKTYVKEMLETMPEEDKLEYLKGLPKDKIWEMAEGKASQHTDISATMTISDVLDDIESPNGQTPEEQGVEVEQPLQDTE